MIQVSVCDAINCCDACHELALPLDTDAAIHIRVPERQSTHVQSIASLGNQSHMNNILEIAISGSQSVDNLPIIINTC